MQKTGQYRAPGVSVRWQEVSGPPTILSRRMDIAGFVGIAQRGPINVPVKVETWSDFISVFGRPIDEAFLGYAVKGFFDNGGQSAWIVRAADNNTSTPSGIFMVDHENDPLVYLYAKSTGIWGRNIRLSVVMRGAHRFDLTVTHANGEFENWRNLTTAPYKIPHSPGHPDPHAGGTDPDTEGKNQEPEPDPLFIENVLFRGSNLIRAQVWSEDESDAFSVVTGFIFSGVSKRAAGADQEIESTGKFSSEVIRTETNLWGGSDGLEPGVVIYSALNASPVSERRFRFRKSMSKDEMETMEYPLPALRVQRANNGGDEARPAVGKRNHAAQTPKFATHIEITPELPAEDATSTASHDTMFTLTVRENTEVLDVFEHLTMNPTSNDYVKTRINNKGKDQLEPGSVPSSPRYIKVDDLFAWLGSAAHLREGVYEIGDGLTIERLTGVGRESRSVAVDEKAIGLEALSSIPEIGIVAIPDLMRKPRIKTRETRIRCDVPGARDVGRQAPQYDTAPIFSDDDVIRAQTTMLAHCYRNRYRFAVLDSPNTSDPTIGGSRVQIAVEKALGWPENFHGEMKAYGALYFPWLHVPGYAESLSEDSKPRAVPPSGHIAGVYARSDLTTGVHKAPANLPVKCISDTAYQVDTVTYGDLSMANVNVILPAGGRGIRVGGARTLSRSRDWRYVSVRRLVSLIEKIIDQECQWTVFEPNAYILWHDIERIANSVLESAWRRGMLDGATAAEAYSVCCDETTNPPEEIDMGRVVCLVGLRPPWPAEYITVRIIRILDTIRSAGGRSVA